jgi:minor histocompatibility antigen H13
LQFIFHHHDTSSAMDRLFDLFQGDSPALQFIGKWGAKIYEDRELLQMYIHLLLSALFPIYIGSHASLRRPPSAAAPKKSGTEDEDDELEVEPVVEGLTPSDAIMFPIFAASVLTVLYFIIKWLEDPAILNKIFNYYFSALGVVGVGKLAADILNVGTTFIFPSVWSTAKETYYVEPMLSQQVTGLVKPARVQIHRKILDDKINPFPGFLSSIKFPPSLTKRLWSLRALLMNHWVFRGYFHGLFSVKANVKLNDVIGYLFGFAAVILYNMHNKTWWLTNLLGFGFSYGTLQLMSPTTFWTGSMVLMGLFCYDIIMVFYTPMMVTVATKIEAPIKLVFPGPKHGSMLGLGDVVLPGIMIAIALRFDLYLHYLHKQSKSSTSNEVIKAKYEESSGQWGERFWTSRSKETTAADGARFPKPYFKASLVGYVVAMVVTIGVMRVWNHAQPALLYLVPGVLIALWGTALVRGEWRLMWEYTEDGSLDVEGGEKKDGEKDKDKAVVENGKEAEESEKMMERKKREKEEHAHHVFLFSLSEPRQMKKAKLFEKGE